MNARTQLLAASLLGVLAACDQTAVGTLGNQGEPRSLEVGIYVRSDGSDNNLGTSVAAPLATIEAALNLAEASLGSETELRTIYVAAGAYHESLVAVSGVDVLGGFNRDFAARNVDAFPAVIVGRPALQARNILEPTLWEGIHFQADDAEVSGESAIAVVLKNILLDESKQPVLTFRNVRMLAGRAGDGAMGPVGDEGIQGAAGAPGGDVAFDGEHDFPGEPGPSTASLCGGDDSFSGGRGGQPGVHGLQGEGDPPAPGGMPGACTGVTLPVQNVVGAVNAPCRGKAGAEGFRGARGIDGYGAAATAGWSDGAWVLAPAEPGEMGLPGRPGKGGGGAGGLFRQVSLPGLPPTTLRRAGGGGGAGGTGGCGAPGGGGGEGGGWSIGLLMRFGPGVVLDTVQITSGPAGFGGPGAPGGPGGLGGPGGVGGAHVGEVARMGGSGGPGGQGGDGGTGGSGAGGSSYAVVYYGQTPDLSRAKLRTGEAGLGAPAQGSNLGGRGEDGTVGEILDGDTLPSLFP